MPKRELTKTEKGVLGLFGALAAFFGIRQLLKAAPPEPGLAILWGIITDAETGARLAGIDVTCDSYSAITDGNGRYEIAELTPGTYTVTFTDPLGRYERLEV